MPCWQVGLLFTGTASTRPPTNSCRSSTKNSPRAPRGLWWAQLTRLYPYVARHKLVVLIGFITQAGIGVPGTLLPLILGVITDCLTGAEAPLAQLGRLTHIALGPLFPTTTPKDPHTLAVFCSALVIICAVKGVFSVLHTANPDRPFPRYRVRPAKRPAVQAGDGCFCMYSLAAYAISVVNVRDIAEATAIVLTSEEAPGKTYNPNGPETSPVVRSGIDQEQIARQRDSLCRSRHGCVRGADEKVGAVVVAFDIRMMFQGYPKRGSRRQTGDVEELTKLLGHAPRSYRTSPQKRPHRGRS